MVWQVLLLQTVTVTKATLEVIKFEGCGPASTTRGATFAAVVPTVTVAVPETLVFWVEVAVTVTVEVVVGAVSTPAEVMVPALELHVTEVLKLPVPFTVAVHWLVPPGVTVEGEQLTVTDVTVEEELPLPPQAAIHITFTATRNKNPSLRTVSLLYWIALACTPCGTSCGMYAWPW
jgi:hypothetical protein